MYGRKETSITRTKFWTSFGQYMSPVPGAEGERINWLNYKTGIKDIHIRMNVDTSKATIALELHHPDDAKRAFYFQELRSYSSLLNEISEELWEWEENKMNENGKYISRIYTELHAVSLFNESDWPKIIAFLKPRLITLDKFWFNVKDFLEK